MATPSSEDESTPPVEAAPAPPKISRPKHVGQLAEGSKTALALALARKTGFIDVEAVKAAGLSYPSKSPKWAHKGGGEARVLCTLAAMGYLRRIEKGRYEVVKRTKVSIPIPQVTKPVQHMKPLKPLIVVRKKKHPPPLPKTRLVASDTPGKKLQQMQECVRCGHEHEVTFFPKSPHSKTGRLHICRTCFGKSISGAKQPDTAELLPPSVVRKGDQKIALANRALRATNGGGERFSAAGGAVSTLARRMILALAERGIELESVKVEGRRIKTIYRIEEDVEL